VESETIFMTFWGSGILKPTNLSWALSGSFTHSQFVSSLLGHLENTGSLSYTIFKNHNINTNLIRNMSKYWKDSAYGGPIQVSKIPIFTQKLEFYHEPQILITCLPWSDRLTVRFGEAACQIPKSEWLEFVSYFQIKMVIYEKLGKLGLHSWSCPRLFSQSQRDSINNTRAFCVLPISSRRIPKRCTQGSRSNQVNGFTASSRALGGERSCFVFVFTACAEWPCP